MYQNALIMMLFNVATTTWHPIFYFEAPFPGGEESNASLIRYRSQGHHTTGFSTREAALEDVANTETKLREMLYTVSKEMDVDLPWDGTGIPSDHQLRNRS